MIRFNNNNASVALKEKSKIEQKQNQNQSVGFGRALSTDERKDYSKYLETSLKTLGIQNFSLILHSTAFPSNPKCDTGLGSSSSKNSQEFLKFVKDTTAFNVLTLGPEGDMQLETHKDGTKVVPASRCPYAGASFAFASNVIDPEAVKGLGLVSEEDVKKVTLKPSDDGFKQRQQGWQHYEKYNATYSDFLKTAFNNFKKLGKVESPTPKQAELVKDYKSFCNNPVISKWLDNQALFYAIAETKYHGNKKTGGRPEFDDNGRMIQGKIKEGTAWSDLDKNLLKYANDPNSPKHNEALEEKQNILENNKEEIDTFKFVQFLAYKQKADMKEYANSIGIKVMSDCPIGSADIDAFSFPASFDPEERNFGTNSDNWGIKAFHFWDKAGEDYVQTKYQNTFGAEKFKVHDGTRIDAAWEYIEPILWNNHGFQQINNVAPDKFLGNIRNAVEKLTAQEVKEKMGLKPEEEVPQDKKQEFEKKNQKALEGKLNMIITEITGSRDDGWMKGIASKLGFKNIDFVRNGATPENTQELNWCTTGTHDDDSLIAYKNGNEEAKTDALSSLFYGGRSYGKGAVNVQVMMNDIYGKKGRYNNFWESNSDSNWKIAINQDYEKEYYSKLLSTYMPDEKNGKGVNMAEVLERSLWFRINGGALKMEDKVPNPLNPDKDITVKDLVGKLKDFKEILKSTVKEGNQDITPLTTKEADKLVDEGKI
ncbi:MAG: 4-alpha-glucanotransferase [bacterium]